MGAKVTVSDAGLMARGHDECIARLRMPDAPILTPAECAKLSEIEAEMTPGEWCVGGTGCEVVALGTMFSASLYGDLAAIDRNAIGIVELRNAAPRMLATIAAHEATIGGLKKYIRERD